MPGSFGATPRALQEKLREYHDLSEARPDAFTRYELAVALDESRAAVAQLLNAPTETVVLVPNATVAFNTVLQNMEWSPDGKDEILTFSTMYGGCGKTVDYAVDKHEGRVANRDIPLAYPCEDDAVLAAFAAAVEQSRAEGRRPKVCVFDTVSSLPGVRFPFEAMVRACRDHGILSLVDGAQGVGQIALDLAALDPDFFLSNCHKWLYVPRGCAVLYVPLRNQDMIQTSLPTSHGYVARAGTRFNPLPPSTKSRFVNLFEFTGTIDNSPYLCVKAAIDWRRDVLGGEEAIREYTHRLAVAGGKRTAEVLGTGVMENQAGTLTQCAMVNVALPLRLAGDGAGDGEDLTGRLAKAEVPTAQAWMQETLARDYGTFVPIYCHGNSLWARLSAQTYLGEEDFEWAGRTLRELCERVKRGEHVKKTSQEARR